MAKRHPPSDSDLAAPWWCLRAARGETTPALTCPQSPWDRVELPVVLGRGWSVCLFHKLPGDNSAAGP